VQDIKRELTVEAMAAERLLVAYRQQLGDDQEAAADLIEGETGLLEAVDAVLARLALIEDHIAALIDHGKKLNARNSRYKAQHEGLRQSLISAMELANLKRLERPTATLSRRAVPPSLVIVDQDAIPATYLIPQPPKVDSAALKAALKDGPVPGAELSNGGATISITRS
jgi:predicted nuclease with TOPRIM domain